MIYIGIDPGKKGYVCVLTPFGPGLFPLPFGKDGYLDAAQLHRRLEAVTWSDSVRVALEKVHSPKGDGHVGAFTFGDCFGSIRSVVRVLPSEDVALRLVAPATWKARMGVLLPPERSGKSKRDLARARKALAIAKARELYPKVDLTPKGCRVPNDNMAEALLLAHYAKEYCTD